MVGLLIVAGENTLTCWNDYFTMRSGVAQAQQAGTQAGVTGNELMTTAQGTNQVLTPFLRSVVQSGMTPFQTNQELVRSQGETGGAASGLMGQLNLQAARTRNPGATTLAADSIARQKMQADSQNALNLSNMQMQRQMQGAGMMESLYGTQLGDAMKAYGLIPEDVDAAARASSTGWFQNMTGLISALRGGGGSKGPVAYI